MGTGKSRVRLGGLSGNEWKYSRKLKCVVVNRAFFGAAL